MRYGLRTLLLLLTGLCVFLGYECDWIMKRRAFRALHPNDFWESGNPKYEGDPFKTTAPHGLWMFGEKGVSSFHVRIPITSFRTDDEGVRHYDTPTKTHIKAIYKLFPEASIYGLDEQGQVFENVTWVAEYDK